MGSRAIYTIIENGETHHFYSQWAANEYTPFAVIHTADNLKNELLRKLTTAQLMPMIKYNHYFDYEAGFDGYRIFDRLDRKQAETMLSGFGNSAAVNMHITLDIDNDRTCFEYNRQCYHQLPADFSVSITDGLHCLEQVMEEAADRNEYLPAVIQGKMTAKLKGTAMPLEQQFPTTAMSL